MTKSCNLSQAVTKSCRNSRQDLRSHIYFFGLSWLGPTFQVASHGVRRCFASAMTFLHWQRQQSQVSLASPLPPGYAYVHPSTSQIHGEPESQYPTPMCFPVAARRNCLSTNCRKGVLSLSLSHFLRRADSAVPHCVAGSS